MIFVYVYMCNIICVCFAQGLDGEKGEKGDNGTKGDIGPKVSSYCSVEMAHVHLVYQSFTLYSNMHVIFNRVMKGVLVRKVMME